MSYNEKVDSSINMSYGQERTGSGAAPRTDSLPAKGVSFDNEANTEAQQSAVTDLSTLKKKDVIQHNPIVWYRNTKAVVVGIKSNWLLIFLIPALILPNYHTRKINAVIPFIFNMLAIIPLAKILTVGIDDITARLGQAYAAVLHAFSGNLVELIILGYALKDKEFAIVRSALLGAILSNILLILGIVFLVGSLPKKGQNRTSLHTHINAHLFVSTSASVLALAVLALVTPATFKIAAPPGTDIECDLQNISHATAIILLLLYAGLLVFQLKTHANELVDMTEFEKKDPEYFLVFDILLIAVSIVGIAFCSRYLVTSIEHLAEEYLLGHSFVGMVLLPLCVMSNALEHWHAIKDAAEDKIDTAISLILNTSVQVALLVAPILVVVGWIIERPLTLDFTTLEIAVLACSVLIVNYLVADNKANWLEGAMLLASYLIIAVAFFYFPNVEHEYPPTNCNPFSRNLPDIVPLENNTSPAH